MVVVWRVKMIGHRLLNKNTANKITSASATKIAGIIRFGAIFVIVLSIPPVWFGADELLE